jgi:hypothetical protein
MSAGSLNCWLNRLSSRSSGRVGLTSSFGAPAHAIESWLSSTADILQVDASFIYIPGVLIVAFRDSDVHSTDILFIRYADPKFARLTSRTQGGLELYRLSLLHQVYRKVVRDEISASQGCRVLRRIERQVSDSCFVINVRSYCVDDTIPRWRFDPLRCYRFRHRITSRFPHVGSSWKYPRHRPVRHCRSSPSLE